MKRKHKAAQRGTTSAAISLASAVLVLGAGSALNAYALGSAQTGEDRIVFDVDRAEIIDSTIFLPFYVTDTQPLRDALSEEVINEDAPLLVMEHEAGTLALSMDQMTYHHVAQGEIAGEPWMVSF